MTRRILDPGGSLQQYLLEVSGPRTHRRFGCYRGFHSSPRITKKIDLLHKFLSTFATTLFATTLFATTLFATTLSATTFYATTLFPTTLFLATFIRSLKRKGYSLN